MDSFSDITQAPERRRVLEMLERGQISAAEADELMAALEGRSPDGERQLPGPVWSSADETASAQGLVAVLVSLARALARAAAQVALALASVISALARLSGRARHLWSAEREG